MDVDSSAKGVDGTVTLGEDGGQEQEPDQENGGKTGYRRSTKRTKISASGSWREGDQERLGATVNAVGQQQHASGMDIIGSSSSSSTGTVETDRKDDDDDSHESRDPDQDDSISVSHLNRPLSTKKASAKSPGASTHNAANRFTIYEDPDDRQIHTLAVLPRLPESWYACPGDNKENMEDDLYDDDGYGDLTPMDEFQSPEESDELNHPHFQHLLNINGYQPDGLLGLGHVDDVVRRRRFTPIEFAGLDTDVDMDMDMDVNEDSETVGVDRQMDNDSVNTTPISAPRPSGEAADTTSTPTQTTPRHNNTRSPGSGEIEVDAEEDEMPRDSFRQRMSFLDAPPRRFLGRNGQRRVHWFMGV